MPQLNPNPWFIILLFSWSCFLFIIPFKITSHLSNGSPKKRELSGKVNNSWTWPWH